MNLENVTIQDCIDMYEKKGKITIINEGKITGFSKAEETIEIPLSRYDVAVSMLINNQELKPEDILRVLVPELEIERAREIRAKKKEAEKFFDEFEKEFLES